MSASKFPPPPPGYRGYNQTHTLREQEMAMFIRRLCSTTCNDKTRAQAMEYLHGQGMTSPLRSDDEGARDGSN